MSACRLPADDPFFDSKPRDLSAKSEASQELNPAISDNYFSQRLGNAQHQPGGGRPAVAGKNATNPQPVYKAWKGHRPQHSTVAGPQIQKQIKHIYAKAAQHSKPTPIQAKQSEIAKMVKEEGCGSAEPAVNFNRPHPDDRPSPPPADSHRNLSTDFEAPGHPFHQQFSRYPHQAGGNFMASSPSAQYISGSTHYGIGSDYGGMSGHYGMGSNLTNYGPGPHQFGGNSPNSPNTFASPDHFGGQSDGPTQKLRKQMKVKDKVITELAEIVEMLEINYGISIDDQTDTLQKFMNIARSKEEDAKKAREEGTAVSSGKTTGKYPINVRLRETDSRAGRAFLLPTASTSVPSYNRPSVDHEHIVTAMEGSLNLVNMEKMVLAKSKARKHAIFEDLESVQAEKLLPGGWIER
ncbi:MAG: hypothetical protein Q9161_003667 [Pseudevernia consocians]